MKKYILLLTLISALTISPTLISAQGVQQKTKTSPSPTGNQVQNQNQTQNQGEEQQIQIQEQENLDNATGGGSQNRNQNAVQNMSEVAKYVQLLQQIRTTGGIGDQVREVAREQNQAQIQIQEQINKLDSKGKLARFLTGTDYGAVKNLKAQLDQNQLRIKQLEQLQTQLSNQGDIQTVQATIQALIQENTTLQERISTEEQTKSLFGWLIRFFSK
jgi:arginine utilization protein RocB